jgi:hypothetical protein
MKLPRSNPVSDMITSEYPHARTDAIDEIGLVEIAFPESCPCSLEQLLDKDFWPDQMR